MKKVCKSICLALSVTLLAELVSMNVSATDVTEPVAEETETEVTPVDEIVEDEVIEEDAVIEEEAEETEAEVNDAVAEEEQEVIEEELQTQTTLLATILSNEEGMKITYSDATNEDNCVIFKVENGSDVEVGEAVAFVNKEAVIPKDVLTETDDYKIKCNKKDGSVVPITPMGTTVKYTPVKNVKATVENGDVILTWDKVAKRTGNYKVTCDDGAFEENPSVETTTFVNLEKGKEHTFVVNATLADGISAEATVKATIEYAKADAVTGFVGTPGAKQVILSWNRVTGCSGYEIEKYKSGVWAYLAHQTQSKLSYTDTVEEGATYQYRIRTYLNAEAGDGGNIHEAAGFSEWTQISVTVPSTAGAKVIPMQFNGVIKSKAPYFAKASGGKKLGYLKKGTKYKALDVSGSRFLCQLANGKKVWVAKKRMKFTKQYYTRKDYSKTVKESFVNSRNISSKTKYMVWTSFYTQRANVYMGSNHNWKLVKVFPVSTGDVQHNSAMGMKTLYKKCKGWFKKSYYVKPVYYFSGKNAFHSRLHRYGGGYRDGGVGSPKTNGCIRMNDDGINFLYNNCPKNTRVFNY